MIDSIVHNRCLLECKLIGPGPAVPITLGNSCRASRHSYSGARSNTGHDFSAFEVEPQKKSWFFLYTGFFGTNKTKSTKQSEALSGRNRSITFKSGLFWTSAPIPAPFFCSSVEPVNCIGMIRQDGCTTLLPDTIRTALPVSVKKGVCPFLTAAATAFIECKGSPVTSKHNSPHGRG